MHDNIIDNLEQYSAKELAKYIQQGIITFEELQGEGLAKSKQDEIKSILANNTEEEDDWQEAVNVGTEDSYRKYTDKYPKGEYRKLAWKAIYEIRNSQPSKEAGQDAETAWAGVDKSNIDALQNYIKKYPQSGHRIEAQRTINKIKAAQRLSATDKIKRIIEAGGDIVPAIEKLILDGEADVTDIYKLIGNDHNILSAFTVSHLDGVLNFETLKDYGINPKFIEKLEEGFSSQSSNLNTRVRKLNAIPEGFTEIYFWGVPASGKTCAVGSIMSAITNGEGVKSVLPHSDSQGAMYMMPLASLFKEDEVCILPPRTKVEETFEMRYTITDANNKEHGIAFIDLSGELFECIHINRTGGSLNPSQQAALNVVQNILVKNRSTNPKIHFFVIEYGSENKRYNNLSQQDLLQSCLNYLDAENILKDNTIGAYIIITKTDKAGNDDIGKYVDDNYTGFFSGLKERMNKWGINTRRGQSEVKRFPFSIGEVCFQNWCIYDPEYTQYIIEEISERSYGVKTGIFGKIQGGLSK